MLLTVTDLKKHFPLTRGVLGRAYAYVKAVDGISFSIDRNEVLGFVGESGCGKSTAGRCILRLIEPTSGAIDFEGTALRTLSRAQLKPLRKKMQIVFQDPLSSLNPRMTVGNILAEPLTIHRICGPREISGRVVKLLDRVGLPSTVVNRYPHEFSGGQCQRIGIARALALEPSLIIADEPVSALDVSIQAQIINLLMELKAEMGLSYLFISHDLGVIRHVSDRIAVMYLGKIVEIGPAKVVASQPLHPYTRALIAAIPVPVLRKNRAPRVLLTGDVPSPANPPSGCAFHTRCPIARPECQQQVPALEEKAPGHLVRCPYES